jgi:hypothetical protein
MKNIIWIAFILLLFVLTGCETEPLSETIKEADRLVEEIQQKSKDILGEERYNKIWGEDEEKRTPDIKLTVTAGTEGDLFEFKVIVENNSGRSIYVYSSDFTLRMPGGLTINPTSDSVRTFEGIELNHGEKTQGYIYFRAEEIKNPGIYYLNFNHYFAPQEFPFRKQ